MKRSFAIALGLILYFFRPGTGKRRRKHHHCCLYETFQSFVGIFGIPMLSSRLGHIDSGMDMVSSMKKDSSACS